jgi:[protein-PII] uridylyltransferase
VASSRPDTTAADLREDLAAIDREPFPGPGGLAIADRRSAAVDRALRALFPPSDRLALVALGGYGRSELTPGSDVDVMILHAPGAEQEAEETFAEVLYPLWNLGLPVGHAVRTPDECGQSARDSLASLTAMLDARLLSGSEDVLAQARVAIARTIREDPSSLIDGLRAWAVAREARFGTVG